MQRQYRQLEAEFETVGRDSKGGVRCWLSFLCRSYTYCTNICPINTTLAEPLRTPLQVQGKASCSTEHLNFLQKNQVLQAEVVQ